MRSVRVTLQRQEQLTADFLDMFSKMIITNSEYIFSFPFDNESDMRFSQFYDFLLNSASHRYSTLKSPITKVSQGYTFNFMCKSNNIVMLLDLSPYMLIYNFGTKTFPIKNLQETVIQLFNSLSKRFQKNNTYEYRVTLYLFSVYQKQCEPLLCNQQVNPSTIQLLIDFVTITIQNSKLLLEKSSQKYSVSEIIQKIFNAQESFLGMKTLLVISSFQQEEQMPILLFTPNWCTYGFINTGGHFGSYQIDNGELQNKLMIGNYFKSKYVFKTVFLQNWEMTEKAKKANPNLSKPITQKFRSILFQSQGNTYTDIFQMLLVFKIIFKDIRKNKYISGGQSVISNMKDCSNKFIHKEYKIPADSFIYILRTKYVQGWEPVMITNSSLVQNSKFKLRLPIHQNSFLFYQAQRNKGFFNITIFQLNNQYSKEAQGNKGELADTIQKMDQINSYNFRSFINQKIKIQHGLLHYNIKNKKINQYKMINYLCSSKQKWGRYFKLKRICFRFQPSLTKPFLQEFINQISFILGKQVAENIFVKQNQIEKKSTDKIDDTQNVIRRVMFTKINFYTNIIELELAFLRFSFDQISNTLLSLNNKMNIRKFKWGIVTMIPSRLISFFKNMDIINSCLFHKKWTLKFKTIHYKNLFKIYWEELLRVQCFDQYSGKSNNLTEKNYYKIIELKLNLGQSKEKIILLRVKQQNQKENEIHMQVGIPPCLQSVLPYFQQFQTTKKSISIPELIQIIIQQLKKTQQQIIKLIDTYQNLNFKLLKNAMMNMPKLMSAAVQKQNVQLYEIQDSPFKQHFQLKCRQIMSKYYRDGLKDILHVIPIPTKFLMSTELDHIEGDINLQIDGKVYSFFLCTPFKYIYLYRKDKNIYYKFINMFFEEYNSRQSQNSFMDLILKEIIYQINEQIYCKDFNIFLEGNFKGGIVKIINNQQFTHMQQKKVKLNLLFLPIDKFYIPSIDQLTIEGVRLRHVLQIFTKKMFLLVQQFFPTIRVNYYFQIRNEFSQSAFNVDTSISRVDSQLFMRLLFFSGGENIDVTPTNLPDLIFKHFADILKNKTCFQIKFYLKAKNNNQKSNNFIEYFNSCIVKLCKQTAFQIERVMVVKKDTLCYYIDNLTFIWSDHKVETARLDLIKQSNGLVQNLSKYIEHPVMQFHMPFKRARPFHYDFVVLTELNEKGFISIDQPLLMRVVKGRLQFIFRPNFFYTNQQKQLRIKLQAYIQNLKNFINASTLLHQLIQSYMLPIEPNQLWLNDSANNKENKVITVSKKKLTKIPAITKKFLKKQLFEPMDIPSNSNATPNHKLVHLNLLFRNYLPLNERIPSGQSLQGLKQYQVFKLSEIHNLRNTYLFENFFQKNHLIFHFEQKEDQNLLKLIAEENHESITPKCKKYLVYYVFCINPLVSKLSIERLIVPHIKQALNRKLFDQVCHHLLTHSSIIQQFQQYFIRGQKKQFKFDLPNNFDKQQMITYIIQHLQIYHYRTQFKSQIQKHKNQILGEGSKYLESLRYIQTGKGDTFKNLHFQSFAKEERELIHLKKSVSVQQLNEVSAASSMASLISVDKVRTAAQSSMMKSSQTFLSNIFQSQQYDFQNYTWLFNCEKPKQNLNEKYGKCLYFIKLRLKEQTLKPFHTYSKELVQIGKYKYLQASNDEIIDITDFKKHVLSKRYSGKIIKRDSLIRSMLIFDIIECVGTAKFQQIQQTFSFILRSCMAEYYIQTYLFSQFKRQITKFALLQNQIEFGQQQKAQILFSTIDWMNEIETLLQQVNGLPFFRYKSENDLLIKDLITYFLPFLDQFLSIIADLLKIDNARQLPLLIFCQAGDQKYDFWMLNSQTLQKVKQNLLNKNSSGCLKLGFILTDYLPIIYSKFGFQTVKTQKPEHSFAKSQSGGFRNSMKPDNYPIFTKTDSHSSSDKLDIDQIKYFKDFKCKQQAKIKRSIFASFQITLEGFNYGSYNINPEIDKGVKEYLSAVDCWLYQKMKLFKLIKNIKESNTYETIKYNKGLQKKVSSLYELRYLNDKEKKQQHKIPIVSEYRLLINLIFNDFPEKINRKETTTQQQKDNKLGHQTVKNNQNRLRLVHHCTQAKQLIQILKNTPIDYSQHSNYKGSEKWMLQKWGRQYVSLLRLEYQKK